MQVPPQHACSGIFFPWKGHIVVVNLVSCLSSVGVLQSICMPGLYCWTIVVLVVRMGVGEPSFSTRSCRHLDPLGSRMSYLQLRVLFSVIEKAVVLTSPQHLWLTMRSCPVFFDVHKNLCRVEGVTTGHNQAPLFWRCWLLAYVHSQNTLLPQAPNLSVGIEQRGNCEGCWFVPVLNAPWLCLDQVAVRSQLSGYPVGCALLF